MSDIVPNVLQHKQHLAHTNALYLPLSLVKFGALSRLGAIRRRGGLLRDLW